jgi:hypothetical protein
VPKYAGLRQSERDERSTAAVTPFRPIPLIDKIPSDHVMDDWESLAALSAVVVGTGAILGVLPVLTRRARLSRNLERILGSIEAMGDDPDLQLMRDLMIRKAGKVSGRLQPLDAALLRRPIQSRIGSVLMMSGMILTPVSIASFFADVDSGRTFRWVIMAWLGPAFVLGGLVMRRRAR